MNTPRPHRRAHLLALLLLGSLAACTPGSTPSASPTPPPSESPTTTPTESPSSSASPAPTDTGASGTPTPPSSSSPAIVIEDPAADASVSTPLSVSGRFNTFEAALTVQLVTPVGDTLCIREVQATSGSGTEGTWQTILGFMPPEFDTPATLRAFERSAQDGTPVNVVEQGVVITPERPPIFIYQPVCGDRVAPGDPMFVKGRAFVFEAQFSLDLRTSSGEVVQTQQVTAESGSEESNFDATVTIPAGLPAGFYDLVAYDNSAEDGSIQNEFPVQIEVR
ncbi:Gmad2 immunoglobulin-like domain-containing protein [Cryobacterium sp. AP23]